MRAWLVSLAYLSLTLALWSQAEARHIVLDGLDTGRESVVSATGEWIPAEILGLTGWLSLEELHSWGVGVGQQTPESIELVRGLSLFVRTSVTPYRGIEVRRWVIETKEALEYKIQETEDAVLVTSPKEVRGVWPEGVEVVGNVIRLSKRQGGRVTTLTLENPPRLVVDITAVTDNRVPPPINPETLPPFSHYEVRGGLHLLSFDPEHYEARVVSGIGKSALATLVGSVGGVAGINGGYFDPSSGAAVDLVVSDGLMRASSLERRGTAVWDGGWRFGYGGARYILKAAGQEVIVGGISHKPKEWVTAFVGDGVRKVGAADRVTLVVPQLGKTSISHSFVGEGPVPKGWLAFTFDPKKVGFPTAGEIEVNLRWSGDWQSLNGRIPDALSAGPLLVSGGGVVIDAIRESFDRRTSIWRATRQVAIGTWQGRPSFFYYEHGTPESFARELAAAGVEEAMRLDSGSSSGVYVRGGYAGLGGYLNAQWGNAVPNAVVMVPKIRP